MRADDGFGPLVAGRLDGRASCPVLDCGPAPENFAGKVAAMRPEVVLVVDAAELGAAPGEVRLLAGAEARASGLSTHAAGLDMLFSYLKNTCGADGWFLGVQPETLELDAEMSAPMTAAAERISDLLLEVLGDA